MEIIVNLSEIKVPEKEAQPKTKTKPATKSSMKENGKNGESFNKFDLLKDKDNEKIKTATVSSKFDLLK